MSRRGRPCLVDPKRYSVKVRLSWRDMMKLDSICGDTGESRSDVLRQALDVYYKLNKYKN